VEWMTAMTYQAASGAGAQNMRELLTGMGYLYNNTKTLLDDPKKQISLIVSNVLTPNDKYHLLLEHVRTLKPDLLLTLESDT
ncbi:Asd/ArgC dimerization domain-containing protein, partial [Acinetobacter baumannii]|uniref:Asd/ArgC dimerization domain-containing protein n=1 Tax=Acinetobacter baumannii TaxID=470 RepID=UPI0021D51E24